MESFSDYKVFIAVVEQGGFAAAARTLGLSRSHTNKLVIGLEDRLGVQLLHRTTRKVSPTPAGQSLYERAKRFLSDIEDAERSIQDNEIEPTGELRINAPMSFGTLYLGSAIASFMASNPRIRIQLILTDRFVDPVSEGFDITIRIAETADFPSLIDHHVVEIKRIICVAPSFIEKFGEPETPNCLVKLPCLHYGNLPYGSVWRLGKKHEEKRDIPVNGVLCSNNAETLRDAAVAGLGVALLPEFIAAQGIADGQLVPVLTDVEAPTINLCLIYPPSRHLSPKVKSLIEFMFLRFGGFS